MTEINVLLVRTDGTTETKVIDNGDIRVLQEMVGGYFEVVSAKNWTAWWNEDGKLKQLPPNRVATLLLIALGWNHGVDVIVGDVVFTGPGNRNGDVTSVTDVVTKQLEAIQ